MEAREIKDLIDSTCVGMYQSDFRRHLGASVIGNKCKRAIWFNFRWAKKPNHSGRLLRLFNRGHKEEERVIEWLFAAGFEVMPIDLNGNQFKCSAVSGHFGGSCDGFVMVDNEKYLLEIKTSNDAQFKTLTKDGVQKAKPEHYQQMQTYMHLMGVNKALYIAVNKNNDDMHVESIDAIPSVGIDIIAKAERIISSSEPPAPLSNSAAHYKCKMCDYHGICHKNEMPNINCRSCKYARPVQDGLWVCDKHVGVIPVDFIPLACKDWQDITKS